MLNADTFDQINKEKEKKNGKFLIEFIFYQSYLILYDNNSKLVYPNDDYIILFPIKYSLNSIRS
jgi:hypothetical protein